MLYIIPSELPNNKGGDIFVKTEFDTGFIEIDTLPESWFMASEEYQGWYVYSTSELAENIQVFAIGGTEQTISDFYSSYYEKTSEEARSTLVSKMYDKYELRVPPYLPRGVILDTYATPIENQFSSWFKEEILGTSHTRKSLHNQLNISFTTSSKPILNEIPYDGIYGDFFESVTIPNLEKGQYWGFYIKIEDNFIPDWNIDHDHAAIMVSWAEKTGEYDEYGDPVYNTFVSAPLPVSIRTNSQGLYDFHLMEMNRLYSNYPEYFLHYEEIEEKDRY